MRMRAVLFLLCLNGFAQVAHAQSQDNSCRIQPYRGAASAQGADARASVVNRGQSCVFTNYGIPEDRTNPAYSGRIIKPPKGGTAVFNAHSAIYTPNPGFVGADAFEYEATAMNRGGTAVRLLVRVMVDVAAP